MTDKRQKGEIERWLVCWLTNVLGPDFAHLVDPNESFFTYGLDSLAAVQLTMQLSEQLGAEVSIEAIFDHPSITELAEFLSGADVPTTGV
jgi:acyl carrier protein